MRSNKQKRERIKLSRAEKREVKKRLDLLAGLKRGTIVPVNRSKVFSRSVLPKVPEHYRDTWFTCKDCRELDLWTARQQQRWYEVQGGEIEAVAIRCRDCRRKESLRRKTARKIHLDGLASKKSEKARPD